MQASNSQYVGRTEMTDRPHEQAMGRFLSSIPPPPAPAVISPSSSSNALSITASDMAMDVDDLDMDILAEEQEEQRSQKDQFEPCLSAIPTVRFCPDVRVRHHIHVTEMSDDEYFSSYYEQEDYLRMRIEYAIKKLRSRIRRKTASSTAAATPETDEARQVQKLKRELKKVLLLKLQIGQNQAVRMENDSPCSTAGGGSTTTGAATGQIDVIEDKTRPANI